MIPSVVILDMINFIFNNYGVAKLILQEDLKLLLMRVLSDLNLDVEESCMYSLLNNYIPCINKLQLKQVIEAVVVKKVEQSLRLLEINPSAQDAEPFLITLPWLTNIKFFSLPMASQSISKHVMPKLKTALIKWIKDPDADFSEIASWYSAWKDIIPEQFVFESGSLEADFGDLIEIMNKVLV